MNIKVQREEQNIKKIDYSRYLEGFQSISTSTTHREPQKIKSKSTLRPFTAHQLMKSLRESINNLESEYIQNLIKRKGLLNIEYEAIKTQPKFQSYLLSNLENKTEGYCNDISVKNSPRVRAEDGQGDSQYKSGRIYNTLGIKRNKSAFKIRNNNPQIFVKSALFNKQYHPLNKFPKRKNKLLKIRQKSCEKLYSNRVGVKSEGQLRNKVISFLKKDVQERRLVYSHRETPKIKKDMVKHTSKAVIPISNQKMIVGTKITIHK